MANRGAAAGELFIGNRGSLAFFKKGISEYDRRPCPFPLLGTVGAIEADTRSSIGEDICQIL